MAYLFDSSPVCLFIATTIWLILYMAQYNGNVNRMRQKGREGHNMAFLAVSVLRVE